MFKGLPLTDHGKHYLDSLPQYEELPADVYMIPDCGNYLLPIDPSRYQWYNLETQFQYISANTKLNREFFLSLPGIESVDFKDTIFFKWRYLGLPFRAADIADAIIDGQVGDVHRFIRFHSTIGGAISAFYFLTDLRSRWLYWHALYGSDHSMILSEDDAGMKRRAWWIKPLKYGQALSALVPIPWGFRLEVKSERHYVIRCLGNSASSGLADLSVEVEDGRVINDVQNCLLISRHFIHY